VPSPVTAAGRSARSHGVLVVVAVHRVQTRQVVLLLINYTDDGSEVENTPQYVVRKLGN
jgi:hypothetical protein